MDGGIIWYEGRRRVNDSNAVVIRSVRSGDALSTLALVFLVLTYIRSTINLISENCLSLNGSLQLRLARLKLWSCTQLLRVPMALKWLITRD